jgi:hypothetical protein
MSAGKSMRDPNALLTSLVNIDRDSLIAILSSEAEAAARLMKSMPRRTRSQQARRSEVIDRAARISRILLFVRHGEKDPEMSEADLTLCKSIEEKLRVRGAM